MATTRLKTDTLTNEDSIADDSRILKALPIHKLLYSDDYEKSRDAEPFSSPGPAAYHVPSLNSIRPRTPSVIFTSRPTTQYHLQNNPAPGAYNIVSLLRYKQAPPIYSLGIKHSKKQRQGPIHELD